MENSQEEAKVFKELDSAKEFVKLSMLKRKLKNTVSNITSIAKWSSIPLSFLLSIHPINYFWLSRKTFRNSPTKETVNNETEDYQVGLDEGCKNNMAYSYNGELLDYDHDILFIIEDNTKESPNTKILQWSYASLDSVRSSSKPKVWAIPEGIVTEDGIVL